MLEVPPVRPQFFGGMTTPAEDIHPVQAATNH